MPALAIVFVMMNLAFFGGRASQSGSLLFLACCAVGIIIYRSGWTSERFAQRAKAWQSIGFALAALYLIFPIWDVLLYVVHRKEIAAMLPEFHLLGGQSKSAFSTILGGSGLLFAALAPLFARQKQSRERPAPLMDLFAHTMLVACIALLALSAYEFVTGFNFLDRASYRPDRMMAQGFYRVSGFTSHPLSLAGECLGFFTLFYSLAWSRIAQPASGERRTLYIMLANCGLLAAVIFLTGSRFPTLTLMAVVVLIPLWTIVANRADTVLRRRALLGLGALTSVLIVAFFASGLATRVEELLAQAQSGVGDQRPAFWQFHVRLFLERPFFGYGYGTLEQGLRAALYDSHGLTRLPQKYHAHNIILEYLVNIGIVGFAALLLIVRHVFAKLRALVAPTLFAAFIWMVAANVLNGLTQNTFFDTPTLVPYVAMFWLMFWTSVTGEDSCA